MILHFNGVESKHCALMIQRQFTSVQSEDRAAGLLQNDTSRIVIPRRRTHGDEQIRPSGGHLAKLQGNRAETTDAPNLTGKLNHPLPVRMRLQKCILQSRNGKQQFRQFSSDRGMYRRMILPCTAAMLSLIQSISLHVQHKTEQRDSPVPASD